MGEGELQHCLFQLHIPFLIVLLSPCLPLFPVRGLFRASYWRVIERGRNRIKPLRGEKGRAGVQPRHPFSLTHSLTHMHEHKHKHPHPHAHTCTFIDEYLSVTLIQNHAGERKSYVVRSPCRRPAVARGRELMVPFPHFSELLSRTLFPLFPLHSNTFCWVLPVSCCM